MSDQKDQVWHKLITAGLVQGDKPDRGQLPEPWYVKVLLAFSGWLAALFLIAFFSVAFSFVLENNTVAIILGSLMIAAAFVIFQKSPRAFFEHLALAISLAGQILIIVVIFKLTKSNDALGYILIAMLQIPLAVIMPNFAHRLLSSFFGALMFATALMLMGAPYISQGIIIFLAAWIWLNEFKHPQYLKTIQPIGYGLVLCLVYIKGGLLFDSNFFIGGLSRRYDELWTQPWMGEALIGMVACYVVARLLKRYGHEMSDTFSKVVMSGVLLMCIASVEANGITVGMMIILLGFAGSNKTLLSLGVVSLLFYVSSYYYLLDATLLAKSFTLFVLGFLLLLSRWLMLRTLSGQVK